ncbi:hypothetical protein AYI99_16690 [Shewanella algae]|nr:hypothetical protein AYI99_16690 [Shewanella algae]
MIALLKLPVSVLDGRGNYLGALVWPGDLLNGGGQLLSPANTAKYAWFVYSLKTATRMGMNGN